MSREADNQESTDSSNLGEQSVKKPKRHDKPRHKKKKTGNKKNRVGGSTRRDGPKAADRSAKKKSPKKIRKRKNVEAA